MPERYVTGRDDVLTTMVGHVLDMLEASEPGDDAATTMIAVIEAQTLAALDSRQLATGQQTSVVCASRSSSSPVGR